MKYRIEFKGTVFNNLVSPLVYCWKRNNQYLYIGMSSRGVTRLFDKHERINKVEDEDKFEIIICDSIQEAIELEKKLIQTFKPIYNEVIYNYTPTYISGGECQCKICNNKFNSESKNSKICNDCKPLYKILLRGRIKAVLNGTQRVLLAKILKNLV